MAANDRVRAATPTNHVSPRLDERQEAPFLTHLVRHHGVMTLTPPANLGRQRQSEHSPAKKMVKKKKKRNKGGTTEAEGGSRELDILEAVRNAGRSSGSGTGGYLGVTPSQDPVRPLVERAVSGESNGGSWRGINSGGSVGSTSRPASPDPAPPLPRRPPFPGEDSHAQLGPTPPSPPPAYPARSRSPTPSLEPPAASPLPTPQTEFVYSEDDPYVIAWEADRAAGISLDLRIERDIQRRSGVAVAVDTVESPTRLDEDERSEIAEAEALHDGARVARALSVSAVRRSAAAAEGGNVGRPLFASSSSTNPYATPDKTSDTTDIALPALEVTEESVVEEEEEDDDAPARMVSSEGRRRFAEAAERRMAMERLSQLSIVDEVPATMDSVSDDRNAVASTSILAPIPRIDTPSPPTAISVVEPTPSSLTGATVTPVVDSTPPASLPPPIPPSRNSTLRSSSPVSSPSAPNIASIPSITPPTPQTDSDGLIQPILPTTLTRTPHIRRPAPPPPPSRRIPRPIDDPSTSPRPRRGLPIPPTTLDPSPAPLLERTDSQGSILSEGGNHQPGRPTSASSSFEDLPTTSPEQVIPQFDPSEDFVYTDLDILLARLEDTNAAEGSHYDARSLLFLPFLYLP